jgi:hypothetical protein
MNNNASAENAQVQSVPGSGCSHTESELKARLLDIWRRVLRTDEIDSNEDFFVAGGDSLLALTVTDLIRTEFRFDDMDFSYELIFENSTIEKLSKAITDIWNSKSRKSEFRRTY